ncbi:MAG: heme exporter protein CcmD [Pseudomonadota bacterium]
MNGYGVYVWPCYALSAVVISALIYRQYQRLRSLRSRDQHERNT